MSWRFELVEKPYGGVTEGPIWDGSSLLFTHIPTSRIMAYDPEFEEISEVSSSEASSSVSSKRISL